MVKKLPPRSRKASNTKGPAVRQLLKVLKPFSRFAEFSAVDKQDYMFSIGMKARLTKQDFDRLHEVYLQLKA